MRSLKSLLKEADYNVVTKVTGLEETGVTARANLARPVAEVRALGGGAEEEGRERCRDSTVRMMVNTKVLFGSGRST